MMVVRDSEPVDRVLRALSDPTRRDIVACTLRREHTVSELADRYPMSFAAVQRHVAVLEDADLVTKRVVHRHRYVRSRPEAIDAVMDVLDALRRDWVERAERFEEELNR